MMNVFNALGNALKVLVVTESVTTLTEPDDPDAQMTSEELRMSQKNESGTIVEEFELEAKYLVQRVRELLREGSVRKLVIKDSKGKYLLEVPMTVGVLAGGVFVIYAPVATALSVIAAAVTQVKIEVVRTDEESEGAADDGDDADSEA